MVRLVGSLVIWAGGFAATYQQAMASIPKPPDSPSWVSLGQWVVSGSDPAALVAAVASGLGLVASAYQIFGPKPYSAKQGALDRQHQNASFAAADRQQQARHDALMEQIAALQAQVAASSPQQAVPFGEALTELATSTNPDDVAIAQQAVEQSPEAAADALMAAAQAGLMTEAERFRQAARLYAPSAPGKAKSAYERAVKLDPGDVWAWIEMARLQLDLEGIDAARASYAKATELATCDYDRAALHLDHGLLLRREGKLEAEAELKQSFELMKDLASRPGADVQARHNVAIAASALEDWYAEWPHLHAEALDHANAAIALLQRLSDEAPDDPYIADHYSDALQAAAARAAATGQFDEARILAKKAHSIAEGVAQRSDFHGGQQVLINALLSCGAVEKKSGDLDAANAHFSTALTVSEDWLSAEPGSRRRIIALRAALINLAQVAEERADYEAALSLHRRALRYIDDLWQRSPGDLLLARDVTMSRFWVGELEIRLGLREPPEDPILYTAD